MRRAAATLLLVVAACSGPQDRAVGIVISVEGGLSGIESFVLQSEDGRRLEFTPASGLTTFTHGSPLSHLTSHMQSGSRVSVVYETAADGSLVAVAVDDA